MRIHQINLLYFDDLNKLQTCRADNRVQIANSCRWLIRKSQLVSRKPMGAGVGT